MSHGIYLNNELASSRGSSAAFQNITIDNNTVISGQVLGISVGRTSGLKISDNIVLQDTSSRSSSDVRIPQIRVDQDSSGVAISGNVVHKTPGASGANWQLTHKSEPGWSISSNKIVSIGTSLKTAEGLAPSAGAPDAVKAAVAASVSTLSATVADASADTGSHGDTFRFYGDKGTHGQADGIDFSAGDTLSLRAFNLETFHDQNHSSDLLVSAHGTSAQVESLAGLRQLDQASSKVSVHTSGDTLVLDIAQTGPDHVIELAGLGHAYSDLI